MTASDDHLMLGGHEAIAGDDMIEARFIGGVLMPCGHHGLAGGGREFINDVAVPRAFLEDGFEAIAGELRVVGTAEGLHVDDRDTGSAGFAQETLGRGDHSGHRLGVDLIEHEATRLAEFVLQIDQDEDGVGGIGFDSLDALHGRHPW